jgi:predicted HicB family RNase H-like nuclease
MTKPAELLEIAEREAQTVATWADLSNFLFDPVDGVIAKAYRKRAEREAFMKTEEYRKIRSLIEQVREQTGLVEGATPRAKSGRFVVRLPVSLHAALEREARQEGVSLNQLVVAKLAASLRDLVRG